MQNTTKKRQEIGRRWRWFAFLTAAGAALRLLFVFRFPFLSPDSFVYGDIAKNWLLHGVYGLSSTSGPDPTFIRLPGYPAVLAGLFGLFGVDHYGAVRLLQVAVDLASCFVVADLARRVWGRVHAPASATSPDRTLKVEKIAFALAALCPFLANYTAVALTETLAIFFAAVALDSAVAGLDAIHSEWRRSSLRAWATCGLAIAASILLRPDGGMLLLVIGGALALRLAFRGGRPRTAQALLTLTIASLVPLVPWTVRNWRTFHVFEPLVPFAANSPGEFVPTGFNRWVKTWMLDYASVEDVAWRPDGDPLDIALVPGRAFDSGAQRQRVAALFAAYNQTLTLTPELDDQFAAIAAERVRLHRLTYYVLLPLERSLDMWLRPRTEMLPITPHWWWFDDPWEDAWALLFGVIGLFYVGCALAGFVRVPRSLSLWVLLALVAFRTLFIAWTENPEPRYVLECYPVAIALAAGALAGRAARNRVRQDDVAAERQPVEG